MLKAFQACIDLEKNVLRIQGREVPFLSDHELPENARDSGELLLVDDAVSLPAPSTAAPGPSIFPGSGRTLGATPTSGARNRDQTQTSGSKYPERDIRILMDLGFSREVAISTLDAAGGNVDVAATLLF